MIDITLGGGRVSIYLLYINYDWYEETCFWPFSHYLDNKIYLN
jgi:hypothetical protein